MRGCLRWSPADVVQLEELWRAQIDPWAIAGVLERSYAAVMTKANRLKLVPRTGPRPYATPYRYVRKIPVD